MSLVDSVQHKLKSKSTYLERECGDVLAVDLDTSSVDFDCTEESKG